MTEKWAFAHDRNGGIISPTDHSSRLIAEWRTGEGPMNKKAKTKAQKAAEDANLDESALKTISREGLEQSLHAHSRSTRCTDKVNISRWRVPPSREAHRLRKEAKTMTQISHDGLARRSLHRDTRDLYVDCSWCGRRSGKLFVYWTERDAQPGRKRFGDHHGAFCCKSCHDSYHGWPSPTERPG